MKKFAFGTQAVVRAWLFSVACGGIIAACSSSEDSPGTPTAGSGGMAGEAEAGKNNGGTQAGNTQGGKGGAGQGGKSGGTAGVAGSSVNQAGEAGASTGDAGASMGGADAGGQSSGGESAGGTPGDAGAGGAAGGGGMLACPEGDHCDSGNGCMAASKCVANMCTPLDPKLATIDQSQLGPDIPNSFPDSWNVYDSEKIGQFLTVGKTGLLTGVELSLQVSAQAKAGNLDLNVYDATSKTLLGTSSLAMSDLAGSPGGNLVADKIGKAFWDLSGKCISVEAGQKLRLELSSPSIGKCVVDKCVGGSFAGAGCSHDAHCTGIIISACQPCDYEGGSITLGEMAQSADDDVNFKTFVLE